MAARSKTSWPIFIALCAAIVWPIGAPKNATPAHLQTGSNSRNVPIENPQSLGKKSNTQSTLNQSLSILASQYVDPTRLKGLHLLTVGLKALQSQSDVFELLPAFDRDSITTPPVTINIDGSPYVALCGVSTISFCRSKAPRKILAAMPLEPLVLFRFGERVTRLPKSNEFDGNLEIIALMSANIIDNAAEKYHLNSEKLVHTFLNAITSELDPHSAYLSAEEWQMLKSGTQGEFEGIGIVLRNSSTMPIVDEIIPGSSADRSGIQTGDIIIRVGNSPTVLVATEKLSAALHTLTSQSSSTAWIFRPSNKTVFPARLVREKFATPSVESFEIPGAPKTLYARITSFSSHTAEELASLLERTKKTTGLQKIVLDLRGNPGGLLNEAIDVSDLFIPSGKIVSVRTRFDSQDEPASPNKRKYLFPMTVLVDSGSASASEILAGALRDHGKAVIIGERSFGKASVQSLYETGLGTALKLTVAHYFTPSGHSIQGGGITPDITVGTIVQNDNLTWIAGTAESEREAELPLHLENPETSTIPNRVTFQEPQSVVWTEQLPQAFALGTPNVPVAPRHSPNWQAPRTIETDPTLRVALNTLNKIAKYNIQDYKISESLVAEIQDSERQKFSPIVLSLLPKQVATPPRWTPSQLRQVGPREKNQYQMTLSGSSFPNKTSVLLRVEGSGDGPAVLVEAKISPVSHRQAKAIFSIPPEVVTLRSLQSDPKDIFVSIKQSLFSTEIPVGPLDTKPTERPKTTPPLVAIQQMRPCKSHPEQKCTPIRISFSDFNTAQNEIVLAPFTSRTSPALYLSSADFKGESSGAFEVEVPNENVVVDGVIGILMKAHSGEVLGHWAVASLSSQGIKQLTNAKDVALRGDAGRSLP